MFLFPMIGFDMHGWGTEQIKAVFNPGQLHIRVMGAVFLRVGAISKNLQKQLIVEGV